MEISIVSVIVGTLVYFGLGGLWYSPLLFGKQWKELIGIDPEEEGNPTRSMIIAFAGTILTVVALNMLVYIARPQTWAAALVYGLLVGVPVIMTGLNKVVYGDDEHMKERTQLAVIDFSYPFVGIILAVMIAYYLG
jgi:hypothetical protein